MFAIAPLMASALSWVFRAVIIKFVLMAVVFVMVSELLPFVVELIGVFINTSALTSSFTNIPPGVWFFVDFFALDVGLPLLISAHVSRFLIRRIPGIG